MSNNGLIIRNATTADLAELVAVENGAWEEEVDREKVLFFTEEHFRKHQEVFPEGQFVAEIEGKVVGYMTLQKLSADPFKLSDSIKSWIEACGQGFLSNHDPNGNVMFGVALGALPNKLGAGNQLVETGIEFMIEQGCDCGVLGGRLPGYHKYSSRMTAEEYLNGTRNGGQSLDPQIRMYKQLGFRVGGLIPNYMPDPKSCNYGILLVFDNPEK